MTGCIFDTKGLFFLWITTHGGLLRGMQCILYGSQKGLDTGFCIGLSHWITRIRILHLVQKSGDPCSLYCSVYIYICVEYGNANILLLHSGCTPIFVLLIGGLLTALICTTHLHLVQKHSAITLYLNQM